MMSETETNANATIELPAVPPASPETPPGSMAAFVAAVRFLTRIPLSFAAPTTSAALHASPRFFPLVGLLIGLLTAAAVGAGSMIWPVKIA